MIDTIILRVHDLRIHEDLVKRINQGFSGYSSNTAFIPTEIYDKASNHPYFNNEEKIIEYLKFHKKGTYLTRYKSTKILNNSKHYYINAFINNQRDFVEFNLSIPKYKYGSNIFHNIPHQSSKNFKFYQNKEIAYNLKISYNLLFAFIVHFFKIEFINIKINPFLLEINRIDLCYNQVFFSKELALQYLNHQKKIRKKYLRKDSTSLKEWETSFMYVTKRYSLKIYHKGSEYHKNDKKEHNKINIELKKNQFDINAFQVFSDKILRYEMTIRNGELSYLFKQYLFRKNCPIHQRKMKIYKFVEKIIAKNDRISKRIGTYKYKKSKERYLENNPYHKIDKQYRKIHKSFAKLLNRNSIFMFKISEEVRYFNDVSNTSLEYDPHALFSKSLFLLCSKKFLNFINEFQVTKKPSLESVGERIDDYNKIKTPKLPKNEMLKFYALLLDRTFDHIVKLSIYSRATFYRYKKRFSLIGIDDTNVVVNDPIVADKDLSRYFWDISMNIKLNSHVRFR